MYATDGTAFTKPTAIAIDSSFFFLLVSTFLQNDRRVIDPKKFKTPLHCCDSKNNRWEQDFQMLWRNKLKEKRKQEEVGKRLLPAGIHIGEAGWECCSTKAYQARAKPWVTSPSLFSLVTIIIFFRLREGECVVCMVCERVQGHTPAVTPTWRDRKWERTGAGFPSAVPTYGCVKKNQVWSGRRRGGTPAKGKQKSACQTTRTPRPS